MKNSTYIFILISLLGAWIAFKGYQDVQSTAIEEPNSVKGPIYKSLYLDKSSLSIDSTAVAFTFNDSLKLYEPVNNQLWHKKLKQVIDIGFNDADSLSRLYAFETEARAFLKKKGLTTDSLTIFHGIVSFLKADSTIKQLTINPNWLGFVQKENTPAPSLNWELMGLGLTCILLSLLGIWFTRNQVKKESESDTDAPKSDEIEAKELDLRLPSELVNKTQEVEISPKQATTEVPEILAEYAFKFIEKYGKFYDRIEQLPSELSEKERIDVLKELMEMGIHAHSFLREGRLNQWQYLSNSPNAQLILGVPVKQEKLKAYTENPTLTDRKFRYLMKIIRQTGVTDIQAYLRDEINFIDNDDKKVS